MQRETLQDTGKGDDLDKIPKAQAIPNQTKQMELYQTQKILDSKGNDQKSNDTSNRMRN